MVATVKKALREEIKEYINHADDRTLRLMRAIIEAENDWWDEISEEEKASIKRGIKDVKEGRVMPHEDVMKKYNKWLSK